MSTIDVSDAYLESVVGGSETATALLNICRHFCEIFRERDRLGARGWFPAEGDDFTPRLMVNIALPRLHQFGPLWMLRHHEQELEGVQMAQSYVSPCLHR